MCVGCFGVCQAGTQSHDQSAVVACWCRSVLGAQIEISYLGIALTGRQVTRVGKWTVDWLQGWVG